MIRSIRNVGIISLMIGLALLLFAFYPKESFLGEFIHNVYASLSCEFTSVAITILLINYLYDKKAEESNKKRLLGELGSEDKGFTSRALKEIKELGYLTDGTLNGLDLTNANLAGLDFTGADLKNVIFKNASLTNTVFTGASLDNANFDGATLLQSNFENCILRKVSCKNCNFYSSIFNHCNIQDSDMLKSNFEQVEFVDVIMTDVKLEDTCLKLGNFTRTVFKQCNFSKADITSANLKSATFERCELRYIEGWEEIIDRESATFSACINMPVSHS